MKTTLNEIRACLPYNKGWRRLLAALGKTKSDDVPLDYEMMFNSLGIRDSIWCLNAKPYSDYCLFMADVAESVLPIFETDYPVDPRPRLCIEAMRGYKAGIVGRGDLRLAINRVHDAGADIDDLAVNAVLLTVEAAGEGLVYLASVAAAWAAFHRYNAVAERAKWAEIEILFVRHFINV